MSEHESALDKALPFLKLENFWPKITKGEPDECWLWTASTYPKGHGIFGAYDPTTGQRYFVRAHRLAHYLSTGEQPEAVMHVCDTPRCCNPAHLRSGTVALNNTDRDSKGRVRHGETHASAMFTSAQIRAIRSEGKWATYREMGEAYGVSAGCIYAILNGLNWKRTP